MLQYSMGRLRNFMARKSAASLLVVLLPLASIIILGGGAVEAGPQQLYVFGDSYVDTGNNDCTMPNMSNYWRQPYGWTWPQHPSGRYSDGRVFSDRFASYLGVEVPVTNRSLNIRDDTEVAGSAINTGINFAIAGSGTFSVDNPLAYNVSVQIERLRTTINLGFVSTQDLANSTALLVVNGNDYGNYLLQTDPTAWGLLEFIPLVAAQIADNAKSLSNFGFKSIAINSLGPHGCLPYFSSVYNYSQCNEPINTLANLHNLLLKWHISSLQEEVPSSSFQILNFFDALQEILKSDKFMVPLIPCFDGPVGEDCYSSNNDASDDPQYKVCSDVDQHIFWDGIHLTDAGYMALINTLFPSHDTI